MSFEGLPLDRRFGLEVSWDKHEWVELTQLDLMGADAEDPFSLQFEVRAEDRMLVLDGSIASDRIPAGSKFGLASPTLTHRLVGKRPAPPPTRA